MTNELCSKTIEEEFKVDSQVIKRVSNSQIPHKLCLLVYMVLDNGHDSSIVFGLL